MASKRRVQASEASELRDLDSRLGYEARGFQRPRSGRMKASKAREGVANVDVLKLKVASRTPRKIRDAFRGPGSCCAPQGLDHKHKLTSTLLEQKGSLLATRQGLRNHLGKKANMITTERRARESQKDACG